MGGCLARLILLPLIIGVFYLLLSLRGPFPTFVFFAEGAEVAAVIAGLFIWFVVLSLMDIRRFSLDRGRINKSTLQQGGRLVVSGSLEPMAPLLKAPFSGQECVGYHYAVTHETRGPESRVTQWTDYEGYALIPSVVSGPLGSLKILAECNKELFYEIPFMTLKVQLEDAGRFFESMDFGEHVKGPGDFHVDKISGNPPDLAACDFKERCLLSGETVLVSGVFSSEHMGIAPDPDSIMRPFHIVPGGEKALMRKIRNRLIGAAVGAGLCAATVSIYFFAFMKG